MTGRGIKITGSRSIQSKLKRLASELSDDADRILAEAPSYAWLADELQFISSKLQGTATKI